MKCSVEERPRGCLLSRAGALLVTLVLALTSAACGTSGATPTAGATARGTPPRNVTAASSSAAPSPAAAGTVQPSVPPASPLTATPAGVTPLGLGCLPPGSASPTPSRPPADSIPPAPSPAIVHPDATATIALRTAIAGLKALGSYRFVGGMAGRGPDLSQPSSMDFGLSGTLSRTGGLALDAQLATRMREFDNSAGITAGSRLLFGDGWAWTLSNVSDQMEPTPATSIGPVLEALTPEGLADRLVLPFAGGFRRAGIEVHDGVMSVRYEVTPGGVEAYAAATNLSGKIKANVWVARDGGYLVGFHIEGSGTMPAASAGGASEDGFLFQVDISHVNDRANVITLPALPKPDPPRPAHAPMDLDLVYRVLPEGGKAPTAMDLSEMAVTLRTRLDVGERAVSVQYQLPDRIEVVVCNTTEPGSDRSLVAAPGRLEIVPLPRQQYGAAGSPGPRTLPRPGDSIDPGLPAVAPAARVGLASPHVDPKTGLWGVAFRLGNAADEAFRTYAKAHPGEYVAVVLDGKVLATLELSGPVADGAIAFTGDYTASEARRFASWLYRDPLPFPLEAETLVEIPAS